MNTNTLQVLKRRYLLKDERGKVTETPEGLFRRVARCIAAPEAEYKKSPYPPAQAEEVFYKLMSNSEFMPNSPTLMNAGTRIGQLSACFVIPVHDSMDSIFTALKEMALIHKTGGGTGFSFSRLRPKGDVVGSTHGVASGPVSFMQVFDAATGIIKQGGRRRGANMGILRVDHPDILEFIDAKSMEGAFSNFNISVAATDEFMRRVLKNKKYDLINPRTKKRTSSLNARTVFDRIVKAAWRTGDPGMIFIDEINRHNPTPQLGEIESTNPCGELPLLPYESCNLGSINLARMVNDGRIDWGKLKKTVELGVRFLDDVVDATKFPNEKIKAMTLRNRKLGLGVMGFADMLVELEIPYDSERAVALGGRIMRFISETTRGYSRVLAKERGAFPNGRGLRNATLTTVAPTGTISIIAGCSSGIEPLFALSFVRNVMDGTRLVEVNAAFKKKIEELGLRRKRLSAMPKHIRRIFVTAFDIAPVWHFKMQAAFQRHTDNSVSKTINLPHSATVSDVRKIYLMAYKLKLKGITIYRYGTKKEQVLSMKDGPPSLKLRRGSPSLVKRGAGGLTAGAEYSGGCPTPFCNF